ncbi:hypothetical protein Tsubulata_040794, partial [Turnera subulata]
MNQDLVIVNRDGVESLGLSDKFKERLDKKWENTVIGKLLGRAIGYKALQAKLQSLWKMSGAFKILDLENNFYMVRFRESKDYLHALVDGPWVIYDNVLSVQPWTPEFRASLTRIESVVVWTQFPDFPVNRYHSHVFKHLGNMIGKTVKLDGNTRNPNRAKFAKVVVCVDITKPLKGTVYLEGEPIRVRYKGLPNICYACGKIGHSVLICPKMAKAHFEGTSDGGQRQEGPSADLTECATNTRVVPTSTTEKDGRGEWMNVPNRTRRPTKRQADGTPASSKIVTPNEVSNRYHILADDPDSEAAGVYNNRPTPQAANLKPLPPTPKPSK